MWVEASIKVVGYDFSSSDGRFSVDEEVKEIDGIVASVRETTAGYVFTLADGAVWAQSDAHYLGRTPKKGQKIVIRKAALGSYMGKLEGGIGFRIKRLNN